MCSFQGRRLLLASPDQDGRGVRTSFFTLKLHRLFIATRAGVFGLVRLTT
jgi:hypothetical protein